MTDIKDTINVDGDITATGKVRAVTGTANNELTTKKYVDDADSLKAPLASPALTGTPTAPTAAENTNTTQIATTAFVMTQIDKLPEPMLFKGTLGTGGTITSLPTAAASNEGWVYKVITDGTYASQTAKIGDLFICANTSTDQSPTYVWTYVPSGDEPSGTVTNVATGTGLVGGPITSSGTIKANLKSETNATNDSNAITNTSGRQYAVVPDKTNGYLSVNVPWEDTHQIIKQDGVTGATINRYAVCNTAANVAAKQATITTGTFTLEVGARVTVYFKYANTANDNLTLSINNSTPLYIATPDGNSLNAGNLEAYRELNGACDFVCTTYIENPGETPYGVWTLQSYTGMVRQIDKSSSSITSTPVLLSDEGYISGATHEGQTFKTSKLWYGDVYGLCIGDATSNHTVISPSGSIELFNSAHRDTIMLLGEGGEIYTTGSIDSQGGFQGNLTGNVTGNCSGSAGSVAWANVQNKPIITSENGWSGTVSDSNIPSEKLTKYTLDTKLDKSTIKSDTVSALTATAMGSTVNRQYAVGYDVNGDLSVNVPWVDTAVFQEAVLTSVERPLMLGYRIGTNPISDSVNGPLFKTTSITANPSTGIVTATGFAGNLTGTASKATGDEDGTNIKTYYAKKSELPTVNNGMLSIKDAQSTPVIATEFTANQSGNTSLTIEGSGGTTVVADAINHKITISSPSVSYPVTSVNNATGAVVLDGADIAITGYSKPSSVSALAATDTINAALGKLEKGLDGKQALGTYVTSDVARNITVSDQTPTGGSDGDIWIQY